MSQSRTEITNHRKITKPIHMLVLDADGTVSPIEYDSWPLFSRKIGESTGIPGMGDVMVARHNEIYNAFLAKEENPGAFLEMKNKLMNLWTMGQVQHISKSVIQEIVSEIPLRPNVLETIQFAKSVGVITGVITASYGILADELKRKLELDFSLSNTAMRFDSQGNLEDFWQRNKFEHFKWSQLQRLMRRHKIQAKNVLAVGDGSTDVELFRRVPGIAIASSSEVLKELSVLSANSFEEIRDFLQSLHGEGLLRGRNNL